MDDLKISINREKNLMVFFVSNNEYLLKEEKGNIINGGATKLHKLQPEKQLDT